MSICIQADRRTDGWMDTQTQFQKGGNLYTYITQETGIPGIYSFLSKQLTIGENLIIIRQY